MKAKKLYYFAYGSNMLYSRISHRVGQVKNVGTWILKNWKMDFNCGHLTNSYANIFEKEGEEVEGVLYEMDERAVDILDRFENYPYNYEKRYFIHEDGNIVFAYVSVSSWFKTYNVKPYLTYLDILIEGAGENELLKTFDRLTKYRDENYDETDEVPLLTSTDEVNEWFKGADDRHSLIKRKYY